MLVFRNNPFVARLLSRLVTQLVPAALVDRVGVLLLSNLAKAPDTPPVAAPVETAINAEAVFKIAPREPLKKRQPSQAGRHAPSPPRRSGPPVKHRAAAAQAASERRFPEPSGRRAPGPLPTVQIPEQPAAAAPDSENT